jgi:DNA-binding winged helix-turn-helix (wHTH) protein
VYRFTPYEADAARGELRKFGNRIRLERKPWLLLLTLLEKPGMLVTRAELQAALWPDGTFVDFEHGLNVALKKLRAALCDSPDAPRFIETVAGEGYRFIAPVECLGTAVQPAAVALVPAAGDSLASEPPPLAPAPPTATPWLPRPKAWAAVALIACLLLAAVERTPEGWSKCRQYFRRATQIDPEFAQRTPGWPNASLPGRRPWQPQKRRWSLIRIRAKFTLRWAGSEFFQEWDFFAAEGALKTAVQLEPNYAPAHHLYSGVLELGGRIHESIAEEEQAIRLDPLSLVSRCSLAEQLSLAGQYDRAVEQIQSMFAIDPHYPKGPRIAGKPFT